MLCKNCGKEIGESKFCTYCGTAISDESKLVVCPNCKNKVKENKFCTICGAQMTQESVSESVSEKTETTQQTQSAQPAQATDNVIQKPDYEKNIQQQTYTPPAAAVKKEPGAFSRFMSMLYREWKKTKIYNFYTRHRLPVIGVAAVILIVLIAMTPSIIKSIKINNMYKDAVEWRDKGNYGNANYQLEQLLEIDPNNKKAKELKKTLADDYYKSALKNQSDEQYGYALSDIKKSLELNPDNEEAKQLKSEIENQYKEQRIADSIKSAKKYRDEGKYIEGYNAIKTAYDLDPDNEEVVSLRNELLPLSQEQQRQKDEAAAAAKAQADADAKAKAEADAAAKAKEAEEKAAAEVQQKASQQQSSSQQSTSSVKLDKTYYGNGFKVDYPSSYDVMDNVGVDFMVMDPNSGSNISVLKMYAMGDISGMTSKDFSDVLSAMGLNVNITAFHEETIDGYKCYAAQYALEGLGITQFIIGDGKDAYYITYTAAPNISTETDNVMTSIVYSFDIN